MQVNRSVHAEGVFGVPKQDYRFIHYLTRLKKSNETRFFILAMTFSIQKFCNRIANERQHETYFYCTLKQNQPNKDCRFLLTSKAFSQTNSKTAKKRDCCLQIDCLCNSPFRDSKKESDSPKPNHHPTIIVSLLDGVLICYTLWKNKMFLQLFCLFSFACLVG